MNIFFKAIFEHNFTQKYFRSFGPGPGIFIMLCVLFVSFVVLKVKEPTLIPKEEQSNEKGVIKGGVKRAIWIGIAVSSIGLNHMVLSVAFENSVSSTLITQFVSNSSVKVGLMLFFICKTPSYYTYVRNFLCHRRPNQIDCIV